MNTINNNKGMFIARPKRNNIVVDTAEDRVLVNKLRGKPYIAYPKASGKENESAFAPVKMAEGLYIAYPNAQVVTSAEPAFTNRIGRIYLGDNYMAPPDFSSPFTLLKFKFKRNKCKSRARVWNFNLFQLFRLRVS